MQRQQKKQLSAHDKILVFDNLRYLLEGLEEYIEKTGYYPNFKRQFRNITISRDKKMSLGEAEDFFRTNLLIFVAIIKDTPDSIAKGELREEFYKWIDIVEINVNNCPDEKLKHFLMEINNVLEGNSEKIVSQTQEYLDNKKKVDLSNPQDRENMLKVFGAIQPHLNKSREQAKLYENQDYFGLEIKNKLGEGSSEKGKQAFNRLAGTVANRHDDFHFFGNQQKGESSRFGSQQLDQMNAGDDDNLSNENSQRQAFIENIKQNIKDWKIEKVAVFNGHRWDFNEKKWIRYDNEKTEIMLIHKSAEKKYNEWGALTIDPERMYLKDKFNKDEWLSINEARCILVDSQFELVKAKLSGKVKPENWEKREGMIEWAKDLESEINSRQNFQQDLSQKTAYNSPDNKGKAPIIITAVIGSVTLLGLIAYKVKKNKIKK